MIIRQHKLNTEDKQIKWAIRFFSNMNINDLKKCLDRSVDKNETVYKIAETVYNERTKIEDVI